MWLTELADFLLPGLHLDLFGIRPRQLSSLPSIILAPFLHAGWSHLASNSVAILLFGSLASIRGGHDLPVVTFLSAVASGLGVWIFGTSGSLHLGASGVAFGLFAFALVIGLFERRAVSVVLSLCVLAVWGGLLLSMIRIESGVSWSGHVAGFAGGVAAARELRRRRW